MSGMATYDMSTSLYPRILSRLHMNRMQYCRGEDGYQRGISGMPVLHMYHRSMGPVLQSRRVVHHKKIRRMLFSVVRQKASLSRVEPMSVTENSRLGQHRGGLQVGRPSRGGHEKGTERGMYRADPKIVEITRALLRAKDAQARVVVLNDVEPDGSISRQLLTYLDIQDAPDIAIEVVQWQTARNEWIMDQSTVLWTKTMKMQMKRHGGAARALDVYDLMQEYNVPLDVVSFNTAISAASRSGKWKKVVEIRAEMDRVGICADAFTYSSLLD